MNVATPRACQTVLSAVIWTKLAQAGLSNLTRAGSISQVSRTSLSTTVRSRWPNGACVEHSMIDWASRGLRGRPTGPNPSIFKQGFGAPGAGEP